ncbi:orotate phosphoribosyltransferase [Taibaiella lutea]|uniref:Orotate phosphoribosyltransferase n=1 Tax=Taibaiella lutea TaxID=2608001 RepID=A0A5M6CQM4_9BACT|nr:orotate phosphoribosyltransferase [Taibaiella lutea]KAA5536690.1 orotate phosphoribosyltransferase [Taibaiella lutea]
MSTASIFAEKLLQIKALKISPDTPFTWASGWKSPVYCDNRKLLSFPHVRDYVKSELANTIMDHFPEAESLAGVATAGIPHGALAADLLRLPFIYVRNKPKGHGLTNQIEGVLTEGQKVVVIEDLVSTGMSSLEAVEALRAAGADVIGMCALFTYGFPQAAEAFEKANVKLITLSNYDALVEVGVSQNIIREEALDKLKQWRLSPSTWGQ